MGASSITTPRPSRRDFLVQTLGLGALLSHPAHLLAQERLPTRTIPVSGEAIPVIGFGSSKPVMEIPTEGTEPIVNVLRTLLRYGGRVVDTSPRTEEIDQEFGPRATGSPSEGPALSHGQDQHQRRTERHRSVASDPETPSGAARWICSRSRVYETLTCTGLTSGPGRTPARRATSE